MIASALVRTLQARQLVNVERTARAIARDARLPADLRARLAPAAQPRRRGDRD